MERDELISIQNEIIHAQENVINTGNELIKAYEKLTELLRERRQLESEET